MKNGRCPTCGYMDPEMADSSPSPDVSSLAPIIHISTITAVVIFLGLLILNTALTIWSVDMVLPEVLGSSDVIFIVVGIPIGLVRISGYSLSAFYLFLVFAIILSLVAIFYTGIGDLFDYLKEVVRGEFQKVKENDRLGSPFLRLVCIFTSLLFISYVYLIVLELIGASPAGSGLEELPLWRQMYSLTRAVVWEEIVVRVVFIGLPMLIYAAVKGKRRLRGYLLGGFGFKNRIPALFILFSSVMFALAHLPGWDLYKMFPTFVAGLAFGYLFVKDGLHSAILLHFFWNFMSVPDKLMDISRFDVYLSLMVLFWMLVGVYYTYYYIKKLGAWLQKTPHEEKKAGPEHLAGEEGSSRHTAGVTIGYVCPNCAFDKAIYTDEGKLKCKRCGKESDPSSDYAQQHTGTISVDRKWPPS